MRSLIALLLAAAVIVLCAFLPDIVAWRQDAKYEGQVLFASVSDIQLEFTASDRTLRETIAILGEQRDSVEIPQELANMKASNVHRIATATIEKYREVGLVAQDTQFHQEGIVPMLLYGSGEGRSGVFWRVDYYDYSWGRYFVMTIDDRTGMVVSVDYGDGSASYNRQDMKYILRNFSEIYLKDLGEEFYEFDSAKILEGAGSPNDGSYLANAIYFFVDDYREVSITFFVNTNGFYTYIS